MKIPHLVTAAALLLGVTAPATAQSASSAVARSHQRAAAVLAAGIDAAGGLERLESIETISITARLAQSQIGQSVRPGGEGLPPRELVYRWTRDLVGDRWYMEILPAPDAPAAARAVKTADALFVYQARTNSVQDLPDETPLQSLYAALGNGTPLLLDARARAASLLSLGSDDQGSAMIAYADSAGTQRTLTFDADGRLVKSETMISHAQFGDVPRTTTYGDYRNVDGLSLPHAVTVTTGQLKEAEATVLAVALHPSFDESLLERPEGATTAPGAPPAGARPTPRVEEIVSGIYQILDIIPGYNVMFVAQGDRVVVIEAPGDEAATSRVAEMVHEALPGKPIDALVLTHHHFDHSSALWIYLLQGAEIITTPGNGPFARQVAAAPRARTAGRHAPEPRLTLVDGSRSVGSGPNRMELIDAGPNPHADEILIAYFPEHKLLWVPDIYGYLPGYTPPPLLLAFAKRMEEMDLDVETIATAHTERSTIAEFWAMVEQVRGGGASGN